MQPEQAVKLADEWTDKINWSDLSLCAEVANRIAQYNRFIGEGIALKKYEFKRLRAAQYKIYRQNETAKDSEISADSDTAEIKRDYERLEFIYQANRDKISTIQTKLRIDSQRDLTL